MITKITMIAMIKSTAALLTLTFLMTACSSGTSVSDSPPNVSTTYKGTFANNIGTDNGNITFNLVEAADGTITGNISFSENRCLLNSTVTGTKTGFNLELTSPQGREVDKTVTTTVTNKVNSDRTTTVTTVTVTTIGGTSTTTTDEKIIAAPTDATVTPTADPETVSTATSKEPIDGTLEMVLTASGDSLSGSYITKGETCSNQTGAGTINASR